MKVRLLVGRPFEGKILQAGEEPDLPEDEAIRLVSGGYAVPVDEDATEKAVKKRKRVETR